MKLINKRVVLENTDADFINLSEIARKAGVTREAVRTFLKRNGLIETLKHYGIING